MNSEVGNKCMVVRINVQVKMFVYVEILEYKERENKCLGAGMNVAEAPY